jgi:hypothetical protein
MLKRVCLQRESKGASRSSGSSLNSDGEKERGEGRRKWCAASGACHRWSAAITGGGPSNG